MIKRTPVPAQILAEIEQIQKQLSAMTEAQLSGQIARQLDKRLRELQGLQIQASGGKDKQPDILPSGEDSDNERVISSSHLLSEEEGKRVVLAFRRTKPNNVERLIQLPIFRRVYDFFNEGQSSVNTNFADMYFEYDPSSLILTLKYKQPVRSEERRTIERVSEEKPVATVIRESSIPKSPMTPERENNSRRSFVMKDGSKPLYALSGFAPSYKEELVRIVLKAMKLQEYGSITEAFEGEPLVSIIWNEVKKNARDINKVTISGLISLEDEDIIVLSFDLSDGEIVERIIRSERPPMYNAVDFGKYIITRMEDFR
jgi:hypothetical protein